MDKRGLIGLIVLVLVLLVVGFFWFVKSYNEGYNSDNNISQIDNPASTYCVEQGNKLEIRDEVGGQIGYCVSPDEQECEEWSFYRGNCSFEKN